jgi:endo-1,4-beta-xylanase
MTGETQRFPGGTMTKLWLFVAVIASACASLNPNASTDANPSTGVTGALQQAALPAGGVDVLGVNTFTALQGGSSPEVKLQPITVTGQAFTNAWRITGLLPLPEPYSSQLIATNIVPIKQDDVILLQFWAHSTSSRPTQTEFVFEWNTDPYDKSAVIAARLTPSWVLYSVPFKAHRDFAIGTVNAGFRLGYNNQAFELGGVVIKNYAKTQTLKSLPFSGFTYAGREANAAWRAAADARINVIRKANLRVKVVNANGQVIPNASVKLEMIRHSFRFGSAVDAERLLDGGVDAAKYKKTISELFNHVVLENDLKWPVWECCRRAKALEAIKYFKTNAITVRGHNLIWPCNDDYCVPNDVPAMFSNPVQLRSRIDSHLVDILGATKGQLVEWDVINEPSANKRLSNVLGEDEMAAQLRRAKQLDPNAKMFLNDYGNLGEGNLDVEFKRIIARMIALGAPLEGIGLQAHFGTQLTPPADLFARLTSFGQFGLPLAITEFDVNLNNEALQADYLRDFLTIAFSSPNVNSFLMWGFWEGMHWIPNAALYRQDWSIKPNGQAYKDLLFKKWWTNASGLSNASGQYGTRGFLGNYRITVTLGAKTIKQIVSLGKTSGEFVIKLP